MHKKDYKKLDINKCIICVNNIFIDIIIAKQTVFKYSYIIIYIYKK